MQFHAASTQMAAALNTVIRVIQPQNTLAIATGVQCEADADTLRLSATDLSHHLTAVIPATVTEPGVVVLSAQTFHALIRRLPTPSCTVTTTSSETRATVRYGRNTAALQSFGDQMLPDFSPMPQDAATLTLPPDTLPRLTRELLFACSSDDTRPILKGVSVTWQDNQVIAAATDGSRLSRAVLTLSEYSVAAPAFSAVFSPKALAEAARLNHEEALTLRWTANLVEFATATVSLRARLLVGAYPDYERIIPADYDTSCVLPLETLRGAIERMQVLSDLRTVTPLAVTVNAGTLSLATENAAIGQAQETLECTTMGPDFAATFNPAYLTQALKSFDSEDILWEFSGVQAPARFRNPADPSYAHIVLPLRQLA